MMGGMTMVWRHILRLATRVRNGSGDEAMAAAAGRIHGLIPRGWEGSLPV
jgi:hypothetical protein